MKEIENNIDVNNIPFYNINDVANGKVEIFPKALSYIQQYYSKYWNN